MEIKKVLSVQVYFASGLAADKLIARIERVKPGGMNLSAFVRSATMKEIERLEATIEEVPQ